MRFLKFIFNHQLRVHRFLYKNRAILNKLHNYCLFAVIGAICLCTFVDFYLYHSIALFVVFLYLAVIVLSEFNAMATSLRSFILYGSIIEILTSATLYALLIEIYGVANLHGQIWSYIILIFSITIPWCFISIIANNKSATLSNIVFSTVVALILYIKDLILDFLPDSLFEVLYAQQILANTNFTAKQLFETTIKVILTPLLISNLMATLCCALKGYWIEKYNDGKDITIEEIMKEE